MSNFESHGKVNVEFDSGILVISATGPWNFELIEEYREKVGQFRAEIIKNKWVVLLVVDGEPVFVPEAKKLLVKSIVIDKSVNRHATAIVVNSKEYAQLSKHMFHQIYSEAGELFDFFENTNQALIWLKKEIA